MTEGADDELIGSNEVAEILGVSRRQAQRVLNTGVIPIVYESGRGEVLVYREAAEQYKATH